MHWLIGDLDKKKTFDDVSKEHWAYDVITANVEKGLFNGMIEADKNGIGHFSVDTTMSKAEFITTIVRCLYNDELKSMPENDIWYENAMIIAYNHSFIIYSIVIYHIFSLNRSCMFKSICRPSENCC